MYRAARTACPSVAAARAQCDARPFVCGERPSAFAQADTFARVIARCTSPEVPAQESRVTVLCVALAATRPAAIIVSRIDRGYAAVGARHVARRAPRSAKPKTDYNHIISLSLWGHPRAAVEAERAARSSATRPNLAVVSAKASPGAAHPSRSRRTYLLCAGEADLGAVSVRGAPSASGSRHAQRRRCARAARQDEYAVLWANIHQQECKGSPPTCLSPRQTHRRIHIAYPTPPSCALNAVRNAMSGAGGSEPPTITQTHTRTHTRIHTHTCTHTRTHIHIHIHIIILLCMYTVPYGIRYINMYRSSGSF